VEICFLKSQNVPVDKYKCLCSSTMMDLLNIICGSALQFTTGEASQDPQEGNEGDEEYRRHLGNDARRQHVWPPRENVRVEDLVNDAFA
jgi:hypothetical protein